MAKQTTEVEVFFNKEFRDKGFKFSDLRATDKKFISDKYYREKAKRKELVMAKQTKKSKINLTVNISEKYYVYLRRLSHEISLKEDGKVGCSELVRRALEAKYPLPGAQMNFDFDGAIDETK